MEIYLVGGAVRDTLLGIPVKDRDWVVVGATVADMLNCNYRQVGRDFPVFLHPQSKEEYALARTERKTGPGHTGFQMSTSPDVTLEEDLRRRDLTINAMAQDRAGRLIDPYGGQRDIEQRKLRHVSAAFAEDPLRVLRIARFAARFAHLGFTVAEETLTLMRAMVRAAELQHLVAERVWQEICRALTETSPVQFFQVLRQCGALAVILPELDRLFGVPQPARYHPEIDTGRHSLMVLEQACELSPEAVVRFAALLHDLGKGVTPRESWPSHRQHEELGAELVNAVCERLKVPRDFQQLARLVSLYHTQCHRALQHSAQRLLHTLENLDAFRRPQRFEQFLLACEADARGRKGLEARPYPQAKLLQRAFALASTIDTKAIIEAGFRGQEIGEQLREQRVLAITEAMPDSNEHST